MPASGGPASNSTAPPSGCWMSVASPCPTSRKRTVSVSGGAGPASARTASSEDGHERGRCGNALRGGARAPARRQLLRTRAEGARGAVGQDRCGSEERVCDRHPGARRQWQGQLAAGHLGEQLGEP